MENTEFYPPMALKQGQKIGMIPGAEIGAIFETRSALTPTWKFVSFKLTSFPQERIVIYPPRKLRWHSWFCQCRGLLYSSIFRLLRWWRQWRWDVRLSAWHSPHYLIDFNSTYTGTGVYRFNFTTHLNGGLQVVAMPGRYVIHSELQVKSCNQFSTILLGGKGPTTNRGPNILASFECFPSCESQWLINLYNP